MRRREFLMSLSGAIFMYRVTQVSAQQATRPVLGFLSGTSRAQFEPYLAAFHSGLRETGFIEGQNLTIEYRWADGQYDRLSSLAAELVDRKVNLIVTGGGPPAALAAKKATPTIPIVFLSVGDPVGSGLVTSLAHPGENITGMSVMVPDLTAKRLELLSELVPEARFIGVLIDPRNTADREDQTQAQEGARHKGLQVEVITATTENEIDAAFTVLTNRRPGALLVGADPFLTLHRERIVRLANQHAIPAIYAWREYASAGGLITFGPSLTDAQRSGAIYAGRILRGEKPADLPVQQPTEFPLVINLKTAATLGLTVPQSILARADEVIE
jgi:putative ABC transport system substrate-binding protein